MKIGEKYINIIDSANSKYFRQYIIIDVIHGGFICYHYPNVNNHQSVIVAEYFNKHFKKVNRFKKVSRL